MQLVLARSPASLAAITTPSFTTLVCPDIGTSGGMAEVFTVSVFQAVTFAALAAVTGDAGVGGDGGTAGLSAAW